MEIAFKDKRLACILTDSPQASGLPVAVINACRRKLIFIKAAPDERSLRNWKSLHYEKLSGDREGLRSIRLNDQYRMVFKIQTDVSPNKITVEAIEDYH